MDKENKPPIENFNLCTEDGLAGLFTEEKLGRGFTAATDKEIRRRNEHQVAKVPMKCSRMQYLRCEYCNI